MERPNIFTISVFLVSILTFSGILFAQRVIDLDKVWGDMRVLGENPSDLSGEAVATGDINGDGYTDIIIGASYADPGDPPLHWAGETYVIFGSSDPPSTIDLSTESADISIYGENSSDFLGHAVASGDVNGDGYDDIIIGAPDAGPIEGTYTGGTYVILGDSFSSPPYTIDLSTDPADITIYGEYGYELSGWAISSGNVNGDSYDDIIIGVPYDDPGARINAGKTYVIFGDSFPSPPYFIILSVQPADITIFGDNDYDYSGKAVASGDVNVDGYDDLIIGAYRADPGDPPRTDAGEAYVIFGDIYPSPPYTIDLHSESADITICGDDEEDYSGRAVASGDVNGDGYSDIIIGADGADPYPPGVPFRRKGVTYVLFGSGFLSPPYTIDLETQLSDITICGAHSNDHLGDAVASGDVNGDGYHDIIIGAWGAEPGEPPRDRAGETYVIFGSSFSSPPYTIDLETQSADITVYGDDALDFSATAVSSGDVNGDGCHDLIIGAVGADPPGGDDAGETYLIIYDTFIWVTSPNGGEIWQEGSSYDITWSYANLTGDVKIELYKGGSLDSIIDSSVPIDSSPYTWTIPTQEQPRGEDYRIRITSLTDTSIWDESNSNVTITTDIAPQITLTSPNGGDIWAQGTINYIYWDYEDLNGNVKIELYKGEIFDSEICSAVPINNHCYAWSIPPDQTADTDYKVRITSVTDTSIWDESDNNFAISTVIVPQIIVTSPNGGESWKTETYHDITWNYHDVDVHVKIELYKGGNFIQLLAALPLYRKYHSHLISPTLPSGTDYRVRLTNVEDSTIWDESDNDFTIYTPKIFVISPFGYERWQQGTTQDIKWGYQDLTGNVKIELYKGGILAREISSSFPIDSSPYPWTIPYDLPSGTDYRIRVTSLVDPSIWGENYINFAILVPHIDVVSGQGPGAASYAKDFNALNGRLLKGWKAFGPGNVNGEVSVAKGDVTGDGIPEIVVGQRSMGASSFVRVFTQDGALLWTFRAFGSGNKNGMVNVAVGDVDGDLVYEIIVGQGPGGNSYVKIFEYGKAVPVTTWKAFGSSNVSGEVRVAAGRTRGGPYGFGQIITGQGHGGGSFVKVWDFASPKPTLYNGFKAFGGGNTSGGVDVGAGNFQGGSCDTIVVGQGRPGETAATPAGSYIKVFREDGSLIKTIKAFGLGNTKGRVTVSSGHADDYTVEDEIIVGQAVGGNSFWRAFHLTGSLIRTVKAFGGGNPSGQVDVAGAN